MTAISTDKHIKAIFDNYNQKKVVLGFAEIGALSEQLNRHTQAAQQAKRDTFTADKQLIKLFVSAAIEMWHRALHSFIVSTGLTTTSKIWSSVSGYYSSHYVMRGYAHLLGYYVLYNHKRVIQLSVHNGNFYCQIESKNGADREHKAYWKVVKESGPFGSDPFCDVAIDVKPKSDSAHRTKANYFDHVGNFTSFDALTLAEVKDRINRISEIEITALPMPNADHFPELENVQIIAYHRIVRFRKYLDELLGDNNKFWNAHRSPNWCSNLIDFQIVEPQFIVAPTAT